MSNANPYRPPRASLEQTTASKEIAPKTKAADRVAWGVMIGVGVFGSFVGALSRTVRPMISGPTHYEMMATMFVLTMTMLGLLAYFGRSMFFATAMVNVNFAFALLWFGFFVGWTIVHGKIWDDMVGVSLFFWFGSAVIGSLTLLALNGGRRWSK